MSILKAYYQHLAADTTVTGKLGTYNFGSGSVPAIFTVDPAPSDAETRILTIVVVTSTDKGTDRATRGGEVQLDLKVYGAKNDSAKVVEELAYAVWSSMDRAVLTMSGFKVTYTMAKLPVDLADPEGYPGFLISCRSLLREES